MIGENKCGIFKIACLNVRGVNAIGKKEEVGLICKERGIDICALSETKLKGKREDWFGSYKGLVSGVSERVRAREGVAIIMKEELWEFVKDSKFISSRLMWVKMKLRNESWVFVSAYAPVNDVAEEVREAFWNELNECLGGFNGNDKVCLLGDLNAKVGDVEVRGIVGPFGVQGKNKNGENLLELCAANEMIIGNTWFNKRKIHKYTWVSGVTGDCALLDYICVSQMDKTRLLDVNVLRGAAGGISDHYLVEAKLKVKGGWKKRVDFGRNVEVVRVEKLENEEYSTEYERILTEKWEIMKEREKGGIEEEWKTFKETILMTATEICGVKKIGQKSKRKGSEWWSEELNVIIKRKKEVFAKYLATNSQATWEEYKRLRNEVKTKVKAAKKRAEERWSGKIVANYQERSKLFWKEINKVRNKREDIINGVKTLDGNIVQDEREVEKRWSEHFGELLNAGRVDDEEERQQIRVEDSIMEEECRNEILLHIRKVEIENALKNSKGGKSSGLDAIQVEMLKKGGNSVVEWLKRLFNICWEKCEVPQDWQDSCLVPIYKGKGDKMECSNYRGISLLSVVGKIYGRVLIERVKAITI